MKQLCEIYRHKFKDREFDVIISVDNNALSFLLKHGDTLFPGTPVVFCGVNYFHDSMLKGQSLYTGVVEDIAVKEMIDIALKLHPKIRQIIIYGTGTPTYWANKKVVEKGEGTTINIYLPATASEVGSQKSEVGEEVGILRGCLLMLLQFEML